MNNNSPGGLAAAFKTPPKPELTEYPFQPHYYRRPDGLALHYIDEGRGQPLIMVHGNPTWSFFWRHLIKEFSPNYRCLALDHMGMGFSSRPDKKQYAFSLADRVADLSALVEHWRLDRPAHLIVHDWGGPIGLSWAAAHPEMVASVTVMNSGARIPKDYRLPWKLALFKRFTPMGSYLAHRCNLFAWGTAIFGVKKQLSPPALEGFLAPYRQAEHRLAIARFVEDIPLDPAHPSFTLLADTNRALDKLLTGRPFSLIWGLGDFVFNRAVLLDWLGRFPHAPFLALPEAGHYLMEDEEQKIIAFLRKFLKKRNENEF